MKRLFTLATLGTLCFATCKKSDDNNTSHAPVITGINMRDINAQPVGPMGTPNVQTKLNNSEIICYPNPCSNALVTAIHGATGATAKVWIVAAVYNNHPDTIPFTAVTVKVENQILYNQQNPLIDKTVTLNGSSYTSVQMAVDSLPNGFYKLYAVIGTDTLNDNVMISR